MHNSKLKIFSFFSGSGFLDLGFEMNGFDVEFVNEFHPAFLNAYKYSRKKMGIRLPKYGYYNGDINVFLSERSNELTTWIADARKDGSLVGFIGGPPCPDFSVAGKQRGRDGENGKLSLSYTRLIIEMKPDFFLFENVKGLWKTKRHGRTDSGDEFDKTAADTLIPDFISIVKIDDDYQFLIFDAKYYCIQLEPDKKLSGNPGIESITKQYLYQLAYKEFVEAHGIKVVRNCFLMPTSDSDVIEKGQVSLRMLKQLDLQDIQIRLLPADMIYQFYLNNDKLDIHALNL